MSEVRALLLTDVVDSTALSERLGDEAMAKLWARHDRVARDLLPVHRGLEIDKTDGFLLLFEEACDAVAYACAYHRALTELKIAARAGLHVGEVILTRNLPADVARGAKPIEVDGIAKPTAARVMSVASGGQTLLTPQARDALGETDRRLVSHGHWRMKGVAEPLELFEIGDAQAPFTPPPDGAKVYRVAQHGDLWIPRAQVPHSLPAERDGFIGRAADLDALARAIGTGARLVTVLGTGGMGKTRLVTRFGWIWIGDWPGGVYFCDLSEARTLDGVVQAVAAGLDVRLDESDPVAQLGRAVARHGPCLVLLDNFEQVAGHAAASVGRWLDAAPRACFVVTSREVLGLPGETLVPLGILDPSDATALFVTRARQVEPGFTVDVREDIEALVRLLDCLPLAIELAAARVRIMAPSTLLARMSDRFRLLASSGGRRDRQSTLRVTLDWSWNLLDPDEQSALAQLAVFDGGFDLEAAEAVLALDYQWPVDAIQALVDKSLVRALRDGRYDSLSLVREYAAGRLGDGEERLVVEARHGAHFATRGTDTALEALHLSGGEVLRKGLHADLDNLVAAVNRAVARCDPETTAGAARAAVAVLRVRGPLRRGLDVIDAALSVPGMEPGLSARLLEAQGWFLGMVGEGAQGVEVLQRVLAVYERLEEHARVPSALGALAILERRRGQMETARTLLERAIDGTADTGDRRRRGTLLTHLADVDMELGNFGQAEAAYREALGLHLAVGNRMLEAVASERLGVLFCMSGRFDEGLAAYEYALAIHRELENPRGQAMAKSSIGTLHRDMGNPHLARAFTEQALALLREIGDRGYEATVLGNLGNLEDDAGNYARAWAHFQQALAIHRELEAPVGMGLALGNLGHVALRERRLDVARALLVEALEVHRAVGIRWGPAHWLCALAQVELAAGDLDAARAYAHASVQAAEPPEILALSLGTLARIRAEQGGLAEAQACIGRALALPVDEHVAALVHASAAWVAAASGDRAGTRTWMDSAEARPELAGPGTEVGEILATVRTRLDA